MRRAASAARPRMVIDSIRNAARRLARGGAGDSLGAYEAFAARRGLSASREPGQRSALSETGASAFSMCSKTFTKRSCPLDGTGWV